jgi:hypothetical protein
LLDDFCKKTNDDRRPALQAALTQQFQDFLPNGKTADAALQELLAMKFPWPC